MIGASFAFLLISLAIFLPAYLGTPRTEDELARMESRGDPEAWNARRLEELRQSKLAVGMVMVPAAAAIFVVALVQWAVT